MNKKTKLVMDSVLDAHFPQSRATYAIAFMGLACFVISLRWLFTYPDVSQFLTFLIFSVLFFILSYLIETVDFNRKKLLNTNMRLDSLVLDSLRIKNEIMQ